MIKDIGFDIVLEQFDWMGDIVANMTSGDYGKHDRVMLVGIKSKTAALGTPTLEAKREGVELRQAIESVPASSSRRLTGALRRLGRLLGWGAK